MALEDATGQKHLIWMKRDDESQGLTKGSGKGGKPETLQMKLLAVLMLLRGWSPQDVDHRAGFALGTFAQMRSRQLPGDGFRARLERVFSLRLWSDERVWLLREACFARYNFDPSLLTVDELRQWIGKLDLNHRVPPQASRGQLETTVLNHLAISAKP